MLHKVHLIHPTQASSSDTHKKKKYNKNNCFLQNLYKATQEEERETTLYDAKTLLKYLCLSRAL